MQLGADRVRRWSRRLILHCAACSGVSTRLRHISLDEYARGMRDLDGGCRAEPNHRKVQVASVVQPDLFVTRKKVVVAFCRTSDLCSKLLDVERKKSSEPQSAKQFSTVDFYSDKSV
jgi:hypothetical protein